MLHVVQYILVAYFIYNIFYLWISYPYIAPAGNILQILFMTREWGK